MLNLFQLLHPLFSSKKVARTRNYRGILSLTYRWGIEDQQEKQQHKSVRLKKKMLELVATQKKAQIRERIQILSDNFLNPSSHGKTKSISHPGTDRVPA